MQGQGGRDRARGLLAAQRRSLVGGSVGCGDAKAPGHCGSYGIPMGTRWGLSGGGGGPGSMSEANNKYCCRKVLFPTLCSD